VSAPATMRPGDELPTRIVGPLTQVDVLRFAGASGDFNPLHHDRDLAARAGFSAPVVMGQMTAGIMAAWISDWCGVERLTRFVVRFVAPVVVGDAITLEGRVVSTEAVGDATVARLEVTASHGATVVVTGHADVTGLPRGS
jgi:3-hydroxybutyryl-CoA dehydratase